MKNENTFKTLRVGSRLVSLEKPVVMGVLNITPDSFYSGSRQQTDAAILTQATKMLQDGATILDIGGYSTRPGAEVVLEEEEVARVTQALSMIGKEFPHAILSVDTFRASVAKRAVEAGASLINDVSGGTLDDTMFDTVAALKVPYILMHMRGTPQIMNTLTQYQHLLKDVIDYFHNKIFELSQRGVTDIIIDPGFGFAKTVEQNFELLKNLHQFHVLDRPLLVGVSRKSMIWRTLNCTPEEALNGTTVLNTLALQQGATILRVHDVKEACEAITLYSRMINS